MCFTTYTAVVSPPSSACLHVSNSRSCRHVPCLKPLTRSSMSAGRCKLQTCSQNFAQLSTSNSQQSCSDLPTSRCTQAAQCPQPSAHCSLLLFNRPSHLSTSNSQQSCSDFPASLRPPNSSSVDSSSSSSEAMSLPRGLGPTGSTGSLAHCQSSCKQRDTEEALATKDVVFCLPAALEQ